MPTPFHKDISRPPGTAAGVFPLFDPSGSALIITKVRFSTDTAQRFVIGVADEDDARIMAGWMGANEGGIDDSRLQTAGTGLVGPIVVITEQSSGFEAGIDGCFLP